MFKKSDLKEANERIDALEAENQQLKAAAEEVENRVAELEAENGTLQSENNTLTQAAGAAEAAEKMTAEFREVFGLEADAEVNAESMAEAISKKVNQAIAGSGHEPIDDEGGDEVFAAEPVDAAEAVAQYKNLLSSDPREAGTFYAKHKDLIHG